MMPVHFLFVALLCLILAKFKALVIRRRPRKGERGEGGEERGEGGLASFLVPFYYPEELVPCRRAQVDCHSDDGWLYMCMREIILGDDGGVWGLYFWGVCVIWGRRKERNKKNRAKKK